MKLVLCKGMFVAALFAISGIFFPASAETVRQPAPRVELRSPVTAPEVKTPTVKTDLLRQPVVQPATPRMPVVTEPKIRQPVIAEPGTRLVPPENLGVRLSTPVSPVPSPNSPAIGNIPKTQHGLRVNINQSRQRQTPDTSFGTVMKKGLMEDTGTKAEGDGITPRQLKTRKPTGASISGARESAAVDSSDVDVIASSMQLVAEQMVALQDDMKSLLEQMKELSPEQRDRALEKLEQMQAKMRALQHEMAGLEQSLAQARAEADNDNDGISAVRRESSSASDVQDLAAKVQQNNDAKADLREQIAELKELHNDMSDGMHADTPEGTFTKEELKSKLAALEAQLDAMSDNSQMDMMNLQKAMNNQAQLMQMMSNIQKMMNDASMSIIRNMK